MNKNISYPALMVLYLLATMGCTSVPDWLVEKEPKKRRKLEKILEKLHDRILKDPNSLITTGVKYFETHDQETMQRKLIP